MVDSTSKVMMLRTPIKVGELIVTSINLREPTAAEIDKAQVPGLTAMRSNIILVSEVSGTQIDVIERLCARDIREATDYLAGFMESDQKTGSSS